MEVEFNHKSRNNIGLELYWSELIRYIFLRNKKDRIKVT